MDATGGRSKAGIPLVAHASAEFAPDRARRTQRRRVAGATVVAVLLGSPLIGGIALAAPSTGAAGTAGTAGTASSARPTVASRGGRAVVAPRAAVPRGARAIGAVAATQVVTGAVALRPRDPAALTAFATAVSTPGSRSYGHYLDRGAFAARFGPTPAAVAAVEGQLAADGLRVTSVSSNHLLVDFRGPVARAEAAFATHLQRFTLPGGRTTFAPTTALTLPAAIAGDVQSVVGLSDVTRLQPAVTGGIHRGAAGHAPATVPTTTAPAPAGSPVACPAATRAATEYGGLTDTQIAHSYGVDGLYSAGDTGVGQTVAIFELEPFARSDIAGFDSCFFGAKAAAAMLARLEVIPVDGGQQVGTGEGEASLDIQDVSALAPGAAIRVYEAPNTDFGALDDYNAIVSDDTAKVISTSWGDCEATIDAADPGAQQLENTLFEQAAAQGQSLFAAAGDAGSDDCALGTTGVRPYLSVDDPGSQPYVTSVGGLTIDDATEPPAQRVWNDGVNGGAGGGGISTTWAQPDWQADSRVPGIADSKVLKAAYAEDGSGFCRSNPTYAADEKGCREVPDVSAQADEYTGAVTVLYAGQWGTVGGTSSSTPLWAAMIADVNASRACPTGGVGFVNPSLYGVASVPAEYRASFTDVTSGNNDGFGISDGLFPATTGYDMASGLGSPDLTGPSGGRGLAYYLCTAAATGRPVVTSLTPPSIDAAQGGTFAIAGRGFESAGGADLVAGVQVGTVEIPAGSYRVDGASSISVTVPSAPSLGGNNGGGYFGDGNGTYDVTVTLTGGLTSAPGSGSRLAVYAPTGAGATPEVDGVGPSGGPETAATPVTVYGSGFAGATAVDFGGVPVAVTPADITVGGTQIRVDTPAYGDGTACAAGDDATTDVCQVDVSVRTPAGTSPAGRILPAYSGVYANSSLGILQPPVGCGCEVAPASTEYDYLPTPTITSVTSPATGAAGGSYADEHGGTVETITGTGLGLLGDEWLDVGPPELAADEDVSYTYVSGTELRIAVPAEPVTTTTLRVPLAMQTLGSTNRLTSTTPPSNTVDVDYAPGVAVSSVRSGGTIAAGSATGGTHLTIRGSGFEAANRVAFVDEGPEPASFARDFAITVVNNDEITLTTPGSNPGTDDVQVCDATSCSNRVHGRDTFIYFPPGDPRVAAASPASGPARGGTIVRVSGTNLGYVEAVWFGPKRTGTIVAEPSLLDSGSTTEIVVHAPPGIAGSKVDIRVVTLESLTTDKYPKSPVNRHVTFTYAAK
jgi:hypothetical protein